MKENLFNGGECNLAKAIDLTWQKFGSITVIKRDYEIEKEHKNERQII